MTCIVTASAAVVGARPAVRIWLKTRSGAVSMPGRVDEQGHEVLVEHDDERQEQPGRDPRPDEREARSSGRSASAVAPRHAAASSNTIGRSFIATTIGVSISGNVPRVIAKTRPHIDVVRW